MASAIIEARENVESVPELTPEVAAKYERLQEILRDMGQVVIGYSGGVDSTLVLKVAHDVLGANAVAVTGDSEAFPQGEVDAALEVAQAMGVIVTRVRTHELANPNFAINTQNRCYHCKTELFTELQEVANERRIPWIADGSHAEDGKPGDHRPGLKAASERGVRSPLREAGFSKADVRALALHLGVPNWDKPSFACLSSRFPYGTHITAELLAQLDGCEKFLRELGFRQFRVRHHDTVARIEVEPQDIPRLVELREPINARFKELGYTYVTLDLEGYRSGKMNDTLAQKPDDGGFEHDSGTRQSLTSNGRNRSKIMDVERLRELLERVKSGDTPVEAALSSLKTLPFEDLGFAKLDHHRALRNGFPEVVYCPGKTTEHILAILDKLTAQSRKVLASRATPEVAQAVLRDFPHAVYHELARMIVVDEGKREGTRDKGVGSREESVGQVESIPEHLNTRTPTAPSGTVLVVSAGTADLPVAEEAYVTVSEMGSPTERLYDVGVAGIHRLLGHQEDLFAANVLIVVAGMEGALASVVGGLVSRPVIAVPTSVGYGASFHGLSALLTMLNSCASGIGVVNIDNGFGAGYLAHLINQDRTN